MNVRVQRMNSAYFEGLVRLFRYEVANPDLKSVILTRVDFAPDLKSARVYYVLGEKHPDIASIERALQQAQGFLKKEMARQIPTRVTPNLVFFYDNHTEDSGRIESLFDKIKQQQVSNHHEAS